MTRMGIHAVTLILLAQGLGAGAPAAAPPADSARPTIEDARAAVDAYLEAEIKKRNVPGLALAVILDGKPVLVKGYGYANVELRVPASPTSVYQLASVTKQFTATAIMMLVEDGKLSLDTKLGTILKDVPPAWSEVTIERLLTHTSGIKGYTEVGDFMKSARRDFSHNEILDLVKSLPLDFPSGDKWKYSNTGYFLLGMVIEHVSGKDYGLFLRERIFKPLEMTQTRVNDLQTIIPERATGYTLSGGALKNGDYVSPTQPYAAGALVSTVNDMIKWDAALRDGKLLKPSSLERMWKPTPLTKGGPAPYGFGWALGERAGRRFVGHGGGIPGFSTQITRWLDPSLTVIVLMNFDRMSAGAIADKVAAIFIPELAPRPAAPLTDPDPKRSLRLKAVFERMLEAEFRADDFTKPAYESLVPKIKDDRERLKELGAIKTFELTDLKPDAEGLRLSYKVTFKSETLNVSFVLDMEGKISGMGVRPE